MQTPNGESPGGQSPDGQAAEPEVSFDTDPGRYRHWELAIDGAVATLSLDVAEDGGLVPGFELKMNSYDLGVDIELYDAVQRLRFEHPEVRAVVLAGGKDRMFCAGANIRMLAQSSHAWKVNFCKFTNEIRNGIEDSAACSGQAHIAALNGTAADDLWDHGGIPLQVIQKYLNFQFSVSLDLFGSETSSNVASYFTAGLKGRWMETRRKDDHLLGDATREVPVVADGAMAARTVPMLTALNLDLRDEYVADCERGLRRWNRELEQAGLPHRLTLPHEGFNRKVGAFAGHWVSPAGEMLEQADWARRAAGWLPAPGDRARVAALMQPHFEPGEFASWIAPPGVGINDLPVEYDYVRF